MMYRYWSGLYTRAQNALVVSNGVGNWFPLRINAQATADTLMTEDWVKLRGDQLAPRDGAYDLRITADSRTWLGYLAKERNLAWALLRRKIRMKGSPRLLIAFGKCFPS